MNPSTASIEQALLDVRKAYRLLHDYQQMVLDALNYITKQLGLNYGGGYPKFSDASPREGKGGFDYWSWDWLNMMEYDFHASRDLGDGAWLRFSMLLVSDTGYFSSRQETLEKTEVASFLPPEQSQTKLGFVISAKGWKPEFMVDRQAMKMFVETGGELPAEFASPEIVTRCYDLARIVNEDSTNELIDELIGAANASGIPLQRTTL